MGFLTNNFIADGFYWFLQLMHHFIPNYVVVVLLSGVIVHAILSPLDMKQKESSMKMANLQPKMAEIKKRYPDPQKQNAKIQELYRKENVKMSAGCLPMIIKMVFLLAFFGALTKVANEQIAYLVQRAAAANGEAVELPGLLWIKNIYMPDSGLAGVMPKTDDWYRIVSGLAPELKAAVEGIDYDAAVAPILAQYSGYGNGWFVLPLVQGVLMYVSMNVSMPSGAGQEQNPMGGPMMKIIMSAVMAFVCINTNTLFTIYFIFSNLMTTVVSLLFNLYFKKRDEAQQEEQIIGE